MLEDVGFTLKQILKLEALVAIFGTVLIYVIFKAYALAFFLGIFIAAANFFLGTMLLNKLLIVHNSANIGLTVLLFMIKVFLVAVIGLLLFAQDKYNIFPYMGGYCSQFIAFILYAKKIGEGK